jgi:hypothetical protein
MKPHASTTTELPTPNSPPTTFPFGPRASTTTSTVS